MGNNFLTCISGNYENYCRHLLVYYFALVYLYIPKIDTVIRV